MIFKDRFYLIGEVAFILSVSQATVYNWINKGAKAINKRGRLIRVKLNANKQGGTITIRFRYGNKGALFYSPL